MLCSIQATGRGMATDGAVRASHRKLLQRCGELATGTGLLGRLLPYDRTLHCDH